MELQSYISRNYNKKNKKRFLTSYNNILGLRVRVVGAKFNKNRPDYRECVSLNRFDNIVRFWRNNVGERYSVRIVLLFNTVPVNSYRVHE